MPQRTPADDRDDATEPKFYIPAGALTSFDGGPFERIRAALFGRTADRPE